MFMVYGSAGPVFTGSLEEYRRVYAATRISAARKTVAKGDDIQVNAFTSKPHEDAIKAYTKLVQPDLERGPLYHAYQIMSPKVITLQDDDDVAEAWRVLRDHKIHQAPVLNAQKKLIGIVSERDLLTAIDIADGKVLDALHRKVKDVMTTPVVAARPVTDIRRIASVMLERSVDGIPIVDENQTLVGFISRTDILHSVITDPPLSLWR